MVQRIYQVDAFTDEVFKGNPAAVIPLEHWLEDDLMQKVAMENNLSETAFFVKGGNLQIPPTADSPDAHSYLTEDATNNIVTSQSELSEQITSPSGRPGGAGFSYYLRWFTKIISITSIWRTMSFCRNCSWSNI